MNFRTALASIAALSFALVACATEGTDDNTDSAAEEALTARDQLQGNWASGSDGLILRPGGTFIWDQNDSRGEGTWSANKQSTTLILKANGSETVFRYIYTPAPILNGFPGPHGFPRQSAKLVLQQLRPFTIVAVTHEFQQADSFCSSSVDCLLEQQDKTWTPASATGMPSCNASRHSCEMGPSSRDTLLADCASAVILNGFPIKSEMWSAQINSHTPIILNGFVRPSVSVTVKKGDEVMATLENCTGDLDSWNLRCTPKNGALGVTRVFELSNKAEGKGAFSEGALAPSAPVHSHPFVCTLAE